MQLDTVRIAIRERPFLDILDLSLNVLRAFAKPLLLTSLCFVLLLMLLNHALVGWMLEGVAYIDGSRTDLARMWRFFWAMGLLVFIQAPLASLLTTVFLGRAAFNDRPGLLVLAREVLRRFLPLLWVYGVVRGVGLAILLAWAIPQYGNYSSQEGMLIVVAIWAFLIRAMRPFINEIILLEQVPMFSRNNGQSVWRRSKSLHGPSSADVFARWLLSAFFGVLLFIAFFGTFLFCSGVFLNDWSVGPVMMNFCLPLSMWLVAIFFSLARYLSYLDLRIRHEGWEVELRLRAEAIKLQSKVT